MPDPLGRACIFPGDAKPCVTVVDVAIVRSGNGEFDHRWLVYFVNAYPFRSAIFGLQAGSTRKRISRGNLASIPLPIPPLAEQHRIVAEIEQQLTRLDAGMAALRRTRANLKRYRAAVLKAACEGRLVPTEAEKWKAGTLGDVITSIDSGKSFKCDERPPTQNETGVAKVSAVTWGTYNELESKTCRDPEKIEERYLIRPGDFLFSRANTIKLVGACVITQNVTLRVMLSDKLLRFRFSASVLPSWVLYWLRSDFGRHEIERLATGNQESMRNIGQERIRQIRFKIPSLDEQTRIVAEVERQLSVVDELESVVTINLQRTTRLRQSILQRAFSGNLVPQHPNEEPAETLFRRINDLPAEAKPAKRKTKPKDQNTMPSIPITTLDELLKGLDSIGGVATPDRLLVTTNLGEDIEKFFDLLREGRNNGTLIIPSGTSGVIKRNDHEN